MPSLVYHQHPIVLSALGATVSARSILGAMIRKRATCSTSSTLPRDSGGFHASQMGVSTLSPSHPLLTSYRVNSRGAWNLFWQACSRVRARANVRRSKTHLRRYAPRIWHDCDCRLLRCVSSNNLKRNDERIRSFCERKRTKRSICLIAVLFISDLHDLSRFASKYIPAVRICRAIRSLLSRSNSTMFLRVCCLRFVDATDRLL